MKLRTLNQLVAVALVSGVALTAAAQGGANANQPATSNASPAAASPPAGSASARPSGSAATGAKASAATGSGQAAHRTRAARRHARQARRAERAHRSESMARNETGTSAGESQYRAALRRCVEGPQAQRDSCIDEAIKANGRA